MSRCAVVMSFDAFAMHTLRKDLKTVLPMVDHQDPEAAPLPSSSGVSLPSTMSLGNLGYRVDSMPATGSFEEGKETMEEERQFIPLAHRGKTDSLDHFGVGLTDSTRTRSGSFNFTPFYQLEPQALQQPQGQSKVHDHKMSPTTSPKLTGIAAPNLRSSPNLYPLLALAVQRRHPSSCFLLVAMHLNNLRCRHGVSVCQNSCC